MIGAKCKLKMDGKHDALPRIWEAHYGIIWIVMLGLRESILAMDTPRREFF